VWKQRGIRTGGWCISTSCEFYFCGFPIVKVWEGQLIYYRTFWVRRRTWAWGVADQDAPSRKLIINFEHVYFDFSGRKKKLKRAMRFLWVYEYNSGI